MNEWKHKSLNVFLGVRWLSYVFKIYSILVSLHLDVDNYLTYSKGDRDSVYLI